MKHRSLRRALPLLLLLIGVPVVLLLCAHLNRKYYIGGSAVIGLTFLAFALHFEGRKPHARELVLLAVMSALAVASRVVFAAIPHFKPTVAIIMLTGIVFGPESGFLTGALTGFVSNFIFGQGPWTPFQMFAWGMIGLLAGFLQKPLKKSKLALSLYGVFAGAAYSCIMDVWTVLWYDNAFHWELYLGALATALPFIISYALSNVVFLLLLGKPFGEKLERVKIKYGV